MQTLLALSVEKRDIWLENVHIQVVQQLLRDNNSNCITQQASYTDPTLFPTTNPTLYQIITAETPIGMEGWQTLMEQLNKGLFKTTSC